MPRPLCVLKFAAAFALCENEIMTASKPKSVRGSANTVQRGRANATVSKPADNPYAMSSEAAAKAVRRAGIVTPGGKLSRAYK